MKQKEKDPVDGKSELCVEPENQSYVKSHQCLVSRSQRPDMGLRVLHPLAHLTSHNSLMRQELLCHFIN